MDDTAPLSPHLPIPRSGDRLHNHGQEVALTVGDLTVYSATRAARLASREIGLSRCELSLLRTLMSAPDRIFTREELCRRVWRRRHIRGTKLVEVAIARLRRKIDAPDLIRTVRRQGYALRAEEMTRARPAARTPRE